MFNNIILNPYNKGRRKLKVITAYASPTFLHHVLYALNEIEIEMYIGMTKYQPITVWDHKEYLKMASETNRLSVNYFYGERPVHSKIIYWEQEGLFASELAFVGSANFTRNGYVNYSEIMAEADPIEIGNIFKDVGEYIDFKQPNIEEYITFTYQSDLKSSEKEGSGLGKIVKEKEYKHFDFPLTIKSDRRKIHQKSGLNWGQRPDRESNQAYIPIPKEVYTTDFFPDKKMQFNLITDDGESFTCVVAQENNKALETPEDNSILGKYFRKRLNVPLGSFVRVEDLDRYGRHHVTIYKINNETYFMDFS
ncbi:MULTISPECIES: restriction endonuclease PLD domain-containing protein [Bacillus]|uniref:restriction endonuclease PLD domain-containing protein n=1 Tax=Bacillus TaxID=1386 RepID=UPI0007A5E017|nr:MULTISPECIES: restriction endonuclease PLD domain-containing protein [Bacillus]MCC8301629.1 NgoFVII family restriction endonuclease [Bacillus sp. AF12]MDV9080886.1 NgoFVII family restriction endonuclease [Bacillus sp. ICE1]MED3331488.1 NgoFVII family restriction endonuclease [Bacillus velezensis]MED3657894.1 NgoFVII family restriction endonuclease [Bacillus velezensis]MED3673531.1 NgoFVII family restriction endonuclease [Bacillus velezensis]